MRFKQRRTAVVDHARVPSRSRPSTSPSATTPAARRPSSFLAIAGGVAAYALVVGTPDDV